MLKRYAGIALITLTTLCAGSVLAHGGGVPKHGGIVQEADDLDFELAPGQEGALIYIEDHGVPLAPAGMSGKLTILSGSEKTEVPLVAAGDKLEAKGVKLAKGNKILAHLKRPQKKPITVRFIVK